MMHDASQAQAGLVKKSLPFPWRCAECGHKAIHRVTIPYQAKVRHDGILHELDIPEFRVPRCANCGELVFDNETADQVSSALRSKLHLLTPEMIRHRRERLGLTPKEVAERTGIDLEELSRCEEGLRIQSRAVDNLLKVFFEIDAVRAILGPVTQSDAA